MVDTGGVMEITCKIMDIYSPNYLTLISKLLKLPINYPSVILNSLVCGKQFQPQETVSFSLFLYKVNFLYKSGIYCIDNQFYFKVGHTTIKYKHGVFWVSIYTSLIKTTSFLEELMVLNTH